MQVNYPQQAIVSALCAILSLILLTACTPHQVREDLTEYANRLSRVLDQEIQTGRFAAPIPYPSRDLLLQIPQALEINLTRFYQLQQCDLGNVVAQRNTALGKVQHFSQRLIYENDLLIALASCSHFLGTQQNNDHAELLSAIQNWQSIKHPAYAMHWSNMLTLSDETKAAFTRPASGILMAEQLNTTGQFALFSQLNAFSQPGDHAEDNIEVVLQAIAATRLPASVWQAQRQLAEALPRITSQLDPLLAEVACPDDSASQQAEILRNVFYLFFIEKIQPLGGRINDFNYRFTPLFSQWQTSDALPAAFKTYLGAQQQIFDEYQQAMQKHVALWQRFLRRCHLAPMADAG